MGANWRDRQGHSYDVALGFGWLVPASRVVVWGPYRPWVKGATNIKMKGAAIARASSSIGMSIRLNFGWR